MDKTKRLTLDEGWLKRLKHDFDSASISDDEMCKSIQETYESFDKYLCDPHTAVAVAAAKKMGLCDDTSTQSLRKVVIIATASPCKFEEAVTLALGKESWNDWKSDFFPSRAQRTMELEEIKPFHYGWGGRYTTLCEVQSKWKDEMMRIVFTHFGE